MPTPSDLRLCPHCHSAHSMVREPDDAQWSRRMLVTCLLCGWRPTEEPLPLVKVRRRPDGSERM